ncbi:MAG: thioredoxin family protein [Pseudomonadota bacterium]|nr:thioredoxin family protein [Pseudomonadota bacterium]
MTPDLVPAEFEQTMGCAAPELAEKFSILGIPTLVLLKDGLAVSKIVGVHPKDEIVQWIDQHLANGTH